MTLREFLNKNKPTVLYFLASILSITFLNSEVNVYIKSMRSFMIYFFSSTYVPINNIIDYPINVANKFIELSYLREENIKLKHQLKKMFLYKIQQEEIIKDYNIYKRVLETKDAFKFKELIPVNVIFRNNISWYNYLIISQGRNYNLSEDLPVVVTYDFNNFYLVGRIWTVEEKTSKILLITNQLSGIPAKIKNKNIQGVIIGSGTNELVMEYVLLEDEVNVGDVVVTSSVLSSIPQNIEIGTVKSVKTSILGFKKVIVLPSYNINNLGNLIVLK